MIGVNLKGTFFGIQAAVPAMLDNGGSIVIIGSDQSLIGKPEQHLYGCTKGAIAQLSSRSRRTTRRKASGQLHLPGHDRHAAHARRGPGFCQAEGREREELLRGSRRRSRRGWVRRGVSRARRVRGQNPSASGR